MNQLLSEPIDQINDERPPAGAGEGDFPAIVTGFVSVVLIVMLVWLFVPGRVSTARARTVAPQSAASVTAPPAQTVRDTLLSNETQASPSSAAAPATHE